MKNSVMPPFKQPPSGDDVSNWQLPIWYHRLIWDTSVNTTSITREQSSTMIAKSKGSRIELDKIMKPSGINDNTTTQDIPNPSCPLSTCNWRYFHRTKNSSSKTKNNLKLSQKKRTPWDHGMKKENSRRKGEGVGKQNLVIMGEN